MAAYRLVSMTKRDGSQDVRTWGAAEGAGGLDRACFRRVSLSNSRHRCKGSTPYVLLVVVLHTPPQNAGLGERGGSAADRDASSVHFTLNESGTRRAEKSRWGFVLVQKPPNELQLGTRGRLVHR